MKCGWGEREKEEEHRVAKAMEKAALLQDTAALGLPFLNVKAAGPHKATAMAPDPFSPSGSVYLGLKDTSILLYLLWKGDSLNFEGWREGISQRG